MARHREPAREAAIKINQVRYISERPCAFGHTERYTQTGICCACQQMRTKGNKKPKYVRQRHATHINLKSSPQITNKEVWAFEFRESVVGGEGQEHVVDHSLRESKPPTSCACGDVRSHTLAECESFPRWKLTPEERNRNRAVEKNVRNQENYSGGCEDDLQEEGELPPAVVHHRRIHQKAKVEEIHIGSEV